MPTKIDLVQMQSLPLDAKVALSQQRIREWYDYWNGNVYVAFSGGKDSTVLAHLVHEFYTDVPLVFVNTGLEYPEIQSFARKMGAEFLRPKMRFDEVISTYGYPIISKENSEAIYYARRILNIHGGGQRLDTNAVCSQKQCREGNGYKRTQLTGGGGATDLGRRRMGTQGTGYLQQKYRNEWKSKPGTEPG